MVLLVLMLVMWSELVCRTRMHDVVLVYAKTSG